MCPQSIPIQSILHAVYNAMSQLLYNHTSSYHPLPAVNIKGCSSKEFIAAVFISCLTSIHTIVRIARSKPYQYSRLHGIDPLPIRAPRDSPTGSVVYNEE